MAELFPKEHVVGFIGSLVLTIAALSVVWFDVSMVVGMIILLVTALIQAAVQLMLFMHIGETDDKVDIWTATLFAFGIGIVTIVGSLLCMVWGY